MLYDPLRSIIERRVMKMDYKDVRSKFVELSGRYDLVNDDLTDNGADFFINAGQKMLDRNSTVGKGSARNVQSVAAGTYIVKTIGLRSVKEVWAGNTASGLVQLAKAELLWLRSEYGEQFANVDQSSPAYYCPVSYRPYPDAQAAAGWAGYYDIGDLILDNGHYTYNGVLIVPPPNATYYVSIVGLFYSPTLSATLNASTGVWTQTKSFWTEVHPDTLLQAALMKLEQFYRNMEGVKDWKMGLDDDILGMDKDLADEESSDISEMGG
jgi:hypothetical protein